MIRAMKPKDRTKYNLIVKNMRKKYCSRGVKNRWEAQFTNRKMKKNEDVQKYADELEDLHASAFPDDIKDGKLLLQRFTDGLTKNLREKVILTFPKTYHEAVSAAITVQTLISRDDAEEEKARKPKVENVNAISEEKKKVNKGNKQERAGNVNQQGNGYRRGFNQKDTNQQLVELLGKLMKETGNSSTNASGNGQPANAERPVDRREIRCYSCNGKGHIAKYCRNGNQSRQTEHSQNMSTDRNGNRVAAACMTDAAAQQNEGF